VYSEEKNIMYTRLIRAANAGQKSVVPAQHSKEQTKEGPPSFVLFESPFDSISTVSRGHPSLVSLFPLKRIYRKNPSRQND
jgi:hypothetical protein